MPNLYTHPALTRQPAARKAYRAHFTAGVILLTLMVVSLAGMAYTATSADAAPATAVTSTLTAAPACTYEDGSSQRVCVWDGAHAGNGIGRSVIIRRGGTPRAVYAYVSHRRAHALIVAWELAR